MKIKLLVILLVLLLVLQVGLLGRGHQADIELLQRSIADIESSTRQLQRKELSLKRELHHYRQIIATIPPSVLMGFEDPEAVFAAFLDFLNAKALAAVGTQVVMRRQLQFVSKPVPLRASDFNLRFRFATIAEVETFLDYLIIQPTYPLRVNHLKLHSSRGQREVTGELSVTLMIPDKLMLTASLTGGSE